MFIKKIQNKRLRYAVRAILALLIIGIVGYSYVYPALTKKTAHETLADISKKDSASSQPSSKTSTTPQTTTEATPPGVPKETPPPEKPVQPSEPKVVKGGTFRGTQGETVSGQVTLLTFEGKNFLRLGDDFSSSNGPDLYVGFGGSGRVDKSTLFSKLKATSGGQNYEIPSNIDPSAYSQVFVFCKIYNHTFGVADLN